MSNLGYSAICVQQTLWLLLLILTPKFATWWRWKKTSETDFMFHSIQLKTEVVSSEFILTKDCFWWTPVCHKRWHRLTWRHHSPSQRWTQVDHIATGHRCSGSVKDCRPFWSTLVDSGPALVRARFYLRLVCGHMRTKTTFMAQLVLDDNYRLQFRPEISMRLSSEQNSRDSGEHRDEIEETQHSAKTAT